MADYYEILEVKLDATPEQIKAQYRFMVQAWHPDKFSSPENKARAEEKLKIINEAYAVLKDAEKRQIFDRERSVERFWGTTRQEQVSTPEVRPSMPRQSAQELAAEGLAQENAARVAQRETEKVRMRALNLQLAPRVVMGFVRVTAGEFSMGSETFKDPRARQDEKPAHSVQLAEFLIGQTPVTNRQYLPFIQSTGYRAPAHWLNGIIPDGKEDHPVVYVNWVDCVEFCKWVSLLFGMKVRLPSEAEWEKAARGADGRIYPWGNRIPDPSLVIFNVSDTSPSGENLAGMSPYGVLDMAGNAWEWVNDFYAKTYYQNSPTSNPPGPIWGESRVLRGGCFASMEEGLRCACRSRALPTETYEKSIGFRCALSL